MKQTIRLTESQLAEVIRKTVRKVMKEENVNNASKDRMYINDIINGLPTFSDIIKVYLQEFDSVGTTVDLIQFLIRISNCSEQIKTTELYKLVRDSENYEGAYENDLVDYFNDKFKEKTGKYIGELKSILDSVL